MRKLLLGLALAVSVRAGWADCTDTTFILNNTTAPGGVWDPDATGGFNNIFTQCSSDASITVRRGEIVGLAISCRALGMGIEHRFLRHILDETKDGSASLSGRIIPTSRNIPARNIYRDNGFAEAEPGLWRFAKAD